MTKKQATAIIERNARANLLAWLQAAAEAGTVYYLVRKVSKSGMSRVIELACVRNGDLDTLWPDGSGDPNDTESKEAIETVGGYYDALHIAARHIGFNFKDRAFRVNGVGMDMVFHAVDTLSYIAQKDLPEDAPRVEYGNKLRRQSMSHG